MTLSIFFRNNFAMLGAVFGSAFALSMYAPNDVLRRIGRPGCTD